MSRRFLIVCSVLAGLIGGGPVVAQSSEFAAARAELQAGRNQIILEELRLDEAELTTFWPVYEAYIAQLAPLRDRKAKMVGKFVDAYQAGEFGDEFSRWLIEENFAIKEAWIATQKEFAARFSDILSVQQVARFYQLENKMDAEVDAQLALTVSLLE